LADIRRDPERLVFAQQVGRRSQGRAHLEIDRCQLLTAAVSQDTRAAGSGEDSLCLPVARLLFELLEVLMEAHAFPHCAEDAYAQDAQEKNARQKSDDYTHPASLRLLPR
jgi:hypothetical protein